MHGMSKNPTDLPHGGFQTLFVFLLLLSAIYFMVRYTR